MAKARKPKSEDSKPVNSGAVVRHQKLCLSIDLDSRRIYGYTELEVVVPDIGIVGLHAENLGIASVLVDGEPTEFEYYPRNQCVDNERRWSSVTSPGSAADIATSMYLSALEKELEPNLLINCYKAFKAENELQEQSHMENGSHSSGEPKQNVKSVRIDYWVEKAETGIHFDNNVLHTDNQIRRARCWFPCIDEYSQRCCYDLEFTVARDLVAVSTGNLLYQVLSKDDPPRKTYVYRLDVPVSAWWISLVVATFEILPDHLNSAISHMCLPANIFKLQNTVGFFHSAFSHYEDYLGAKFPFGSYKQVFISPEMAVSPMCLGASMSIFSSQILYDEKVIDKTIDTRVKLAHALARQWFGVYIAPAAPDDEWLLDGLAGFLTDSFIKKYLGNNEARYRRFKANCAVCKADVSGATTLSSTASTKDLYGTQSIGLCGKIRSWKSVATLQMLEKQMGPESFCKILQTIVSRSLDAGQSSRTLSTKEFRHFANKVGNLERPFLKEFFPRWVGSCGCPILRMGFSYNKRKNIVELAALRDCTASQSMDVVPVANADSGNGESDAGWPGMMSIRVNELDGMYDHPILPMAGDNWQLLEIQCHSKLASRRFQKPKKGLKADGSDDNGDAALDSRSSSESPLLWIRADPEMEYLVEIQFNQPVQMWINQLEKDKDVVAQSQAIRMLETLPQISFSVVNALTHFLCDSKAFWRVRIEAAFALANSSTEETDWSGLLQLMKFYKVRRYFSDVGLPKPNDFRDIPEYFVLEAIPRAVAMVRSSDGKSPREAVEFVSQLLKYNDNNDNVYSDVFWLAALVQSIGEFEFGQQSILLLPSLLKRIDRLLQFDRLMPSYNGTLTVSCIRTLTQIALKLSAFIPLDRVSELVQGFKDLSTVWQVRIEASRALLDLEFQYKGLEAALSLFMKYLEEEQSLRGQVKLAVHAMRLCQMYQASESKDDIKSITLVALLRLFEGPMAYNNVYLRHYLFCILQIFSGRLPTLYGAPRDKTLHLGDGETCTEQKNMFAPFVEETKPVEAPVEITHGTKQENIFAPFVVETKPVEAPVEVTQISDDGLAIPDIPKEVDTVSSSRDKRMPVFKIKVKHSGVTSKGDETENQSVEKSRGVRNEPDRGASSSVSVDAPQRNYTDISLSNQHMEEVNSCHDPGSRVTTSIGSAKLAGEGDDLGKELQCTADSSKVLTQTQLHKSSLHDIDGDDHIIKDVMKSTSLETHSAVRYNHDDGSVARKEPPVGKEKKNGKDKKRRREDHKSHKDDPEYLERKRLKKERKRKEKELSKLLNEQKSSVVVLPSKKEEPVMKEPEKMLVNMQTKPNEVAKSDLLTRKTDAKPEASGVSTASKFRIKIKNRTLSKP